MLNLNNRLRVAIGAVSPPKIPNMGLGMDFIPYPGMTMGTLVAGRQGSGKTSWNARYLVDYATAFPRRAIFVLDMSGKLRDEALSIMAQRPLAEVLLNRVINDELGHPEHVIPMPEFADYGLSMEEQAQRVAKNLTNLSPRLMIQTPVMAQALTETAPEMFRLLQVIKNEHGESWQVSEAKKLLSNPSLLMLACQQFGGFAPQAKYYFEQLLSQDVSAHDRELRILALRNVLGMIEGRETRARIGYYKSGFTPKEVIEKGLIVFVTGEHLTNNDAAQRYLFTQMFSLIIAEINKRQPDDPNDEYVLLVIDETPVLLEIDGMAEQIGKVSPLYRSRKLQLMVIIQALHQLDQVLVKKIWSLGNIVLFGMNDFNDCYTAAQQLCMYNPAASKEPLESRPMAENDRGQYLLAANWLQHLEKRQCVIRAFKNEAQQDHQLRFVPRTRQNPKSLPQEALSALKEKLLRPRSVAVRDALEVVNQRNLNAGTGRKSL